MESKQACKEFVRHFQWALGLLAMVLMLTSCNQKEFIQKLVPKDDDRVARQFIDVIRKGDLTSAQQMLDDSIRGEKARTGLQELHKVLDHGEPVSWETIGVNVGNFNGSRKTNLSYQIHFQDAWVMGNVYVDGTRILGSHFQPISDSLEVLNGFSLTGKSPLHYMVLAGCIVIPLFILYALVLCIRTPLRRKWLWVLFILFGVVQFRLDWTNGQHDIQPISALFFGASAFRAGPYAAWVFSCAIPLGALIFLIRRRSLIRS